MTRRRIESFGNNSTDLAYLEVLPACTCIRGLKRPQILGSLMRDFVFNSAGHDDDQEFCIVQGSASDSSQHTNLNLGS